MAIFHDLEAVTIEVDVSIEIHLVERLQGDLALSMVLGLIRRLLEGEVMLDRTTGKSGLLVSAWAERRDGDPESSQQRNRSKYGKEDGRLQATADLPGHVEGHAEQNGR